MRALVGTSGFAYKPWKGPFYPRNLPEHGMLAYYSRVFDSVEINNTFYRMPQPGLLRRWAEQVPGSFRFVLKAPRRISHAAFIDAEAVAYFFDVALELGNQLGPALIQLPPSARVEHAKLAELLRLIPADQRCAFEFRHESWRDPDVLAMLRDRDCAWCVADTEDKRGELLSTASWGYVRMRRPDYAREALRGWVQRLRRQRWNDVFVFFKHEEEGRGPELARLFIDEWRSETEAARAPAP